jgi:hypothetical protein
MAVNVVPQAAVRSASALNAGTRRAAGAHSVILPRPSWRLGRMADWTELRTVLDKAGRSVRLTWSELDRIVGGLPGSATQYRAWWSGDRPHVRAWRSAGYRVVDLVLGKEVTFVRTGEPHPADWATAERAIARPAVAPGDSVTHADLLLVACVKTKLNVPAAARDLYVSPLFQKERAYGERRGVPWFILSAEHGLVAPDEWLAPYERYLPDTPAGYRAAWGRWVVERLDLLAGPLTGRVVEVHAGATYVEAIAAPLTAKGATLVDRLLGLTMGERLAWYDSHGFSIDVSAGSTAGDASDDRAAPFVQRLRGEAAALTPAEFLQAQRAGLRVPGLYSWWVDAAGAADLSRGLGLTVRAGLIYAGLAGATRWPSGKQSTNTLWSRIAGMHLGGNHEFSTFRRTLGAVLANATDSDSIDEAALTAWMHEHLKVLAVPYPDADTLGSLEEAVLTALDPPLNLQGMSPTPLRRRITRLRSQHR